MNAVRPELAVGAIIVAGDAILLIERGHEPDAGKWSVPGGRVEAGENVVAALGREVREETGIEIKVGELAGWVERIRETHHFVILDFYATPASTDQIPRAGDDARSACWVPLTDVAQLDLVDGLLDFLGTVLGSVAPWQ